MSKIFRRLYQVLILLFPFVSWYRRFISAGRVNNYNLGLGVKLWALRKGFLLESIELCQINKTNYKNYLSDRYYRKLHPINGELTKIIDNKFYLPFLLKDFPDLVPEYYYLIENGKMVNLFTANKNTSDFITFFKTKKKLVLKPCSYSLGIGFYLLEYESGNFFLNKKIMDEAQLKKIIKTLDNYIVTEYVNQHKDIAEINASSVNTLRLLCVRDVESNSFFIPRLYHRFGMDGKLVDNTGSGNGIAAFVDTETGIIKNSGLIKVGDEPMKNIVISVHPDSNEQISGIKLPHFQLVKTKVLEIMNSLSFLKYAGLDIVITEEGFKIIEINSLPTILAIQVEQGLLEDEKLKKFFNGNH